MQTQLMALTGLLQRKPLRTITALQSRFLQAAALKEKAALPEAAQLALAVILTLQQEQEATRTLLTGIRPLAKASQAFSLFSNSQIPPQPLAMKTGT